MVLDLLDLATLISKKVATIRLRIYTDSRDIARELAGQALIAYRYS